MTQQRVFYACQAILYRERNKTTGGSWVYLTGAQSVGINSTIESNSLSDIGRFQRKYKFESRNRQHEITISRVIPKGKNLFYNCSVGNLSSYSSSHILSNNNIGCQGPDTDQDNTGLRNYDIAIVYGSDENSRIGMGGATTNTVVYKSCLVTNISYNIGIDGVTEDITLISRIAKYDDLTITNEFPWSSDDSITQTYEEAGNILRRQDIDLSQSVIPTEANQIFKLESPLTFNGSSVFGLQSINIAVAIEYTELNDIGIWRGADNEDDVNQWRFVNIPLEVTCSFVGVLRSIYPYQDILRQDETFPSDRQIKIVANSNFNSSGKFFVWDLGSKNYLNDISTSGGDVDGGNVELTLSYRNDYSDIVPYQDTTIHTITNTGPY